MKALLAVLVVLLGLAVVADRVAVGIAEERVATELASTGALQSAPTVDITGFPFVTQAVAGRYDDVRISLTADQLGQPEGTRADVALHGVRVPLPAVLSGSVQQVPVDRIDGTATLSYELLSAELGADTTLEQEGDGLRITRTVELLGRQIPVTAVGSVAVDDGAVVIDVDQAGGVDLPEPLAARAGDLLDLRYELPPLPFGLQLTDVRSVGDGVEVRVEALDSVLGTTE